MISVVNWHRAVIPETASLREAFHSLNEAAVKVCLCVCEENCFVGLLTDGDLRRGLLKGHTLNDSVEPIINRSPLVAKSSDRWVDIYNIMLDRSLLQIPLVDQYRRLTGLYIRDQLGVMDSHDHLMVIMAGGQGKRLRPYTDTCPKPMLDVSGKPILQRILEKARGQGFKKFVFCINYHGAQIKDFFGDGSRFGVDIEYIEEDTPLGTAGALSLFRQLPENTFVVSNGDVLADIDYFDLLRFLEFHEASAAMAVKLYEWTNPYGVVEVTGTQITGFSEKPIYRSHINSGVYALSPLVFQLLEEGKFCDMPSVFEILRDSGLKTIAYPMYESWLDIGRPDDLEVARNSILDTKD